MIKKYIHIPCYQEAADNSGLEQSGKVLIIEMESDDSLCRVIVDGRVEIVLVEDLKKATWKL